MGNVAVMCPVCRGWDVTKGWNYGNHFYKCGKCGYVWH